MEKLILEMLQEKLKRDIENNQGAEKCQELLEFIKLAEETVKARDTEILAELEARSNESETPGFCPK